MNPTCRGGGISQQASQLSLWIFGLTYKYGMGGL